MLCIDRSKAFHFCGHVFYPSGTNVLTKFHEDWAQNVSSRPFTCFHYIHIEKTAPSPSAFLLWKYKENDPSPGCHVFLRIQTIFELNHRIQETNTTIVTSREKLPHPPGGHVFPPIMTIFELVRNINETNVLTKNTAPLPGGHTNILTKLHEDWASNVTSTMFTTFELDQDIIGSNLLTKFHANKKINVATRVFTRQNVEDERRTTDKRLSKSSP
ncbi:hypothetical protein DPMN_062060 [Dreissena polymorpha]|uniref:Uncharacterized protein n=1 Tax=Dreissena polymorpha TaxID=45954 RepID=A0A9D4C858_DREPO|nr:hypothetical protein DPMN_062060 [Dreissena polymorpha]